MSPQRSHATVEARLHPPRVEGLVRPRLLGPLTDARGCGVVVVVAPAGSGKTTLLARAAGECAGATAWYTADADDRPGPGFLAHVARSVALARGRDVPVPDSATDLLEVLGEPGAEPLLLVIDDAHELVGSPAEDALATVLRWRPPGVRILVGTRRQPANAPRLLVSGDLLELDAEALRFRSWEVEELFREVYGAALSPEGAAALTRRTGGWAAGLMLFRLSVTGKSEQERERAIDELGGRSRLLRSYLTRTVIGELDPDHREFLLATCTLDPLTGPLCDALLDREGSAAVLEELSARQFFTTPAPDGHTYRYHPVLRTLLEGLLQEELGPHAAAEMYARAARLMESVGWLREAMRAYAIAEDFASVARVLQRSGDDLTVSADALTEALPTDDPWLALVGARRLLREGAVRAAVEAYRHAESLLDDGDFRMRCAEERAAATVWSADARTARTPTTLAEALRRCTRVLDPEPLDHPLARGLSLLLCGELGPAQVELDAVPATHRVERLLAELATQCARVAAGETAGLVARLEGISLAAEVEEQPWVARVARGFQRCALLVTSPEPWRPDSCAAQVEQCRRDEDLWGALLLAGALGAALRLRADPAADGWLREAEELADVLDAPVLAAWARALRGAPTAHDRSLGMPSLERVLAAARRPPERAGHAPVVRVTCLARFEVLRDGEVVRIPGLRPRPEALLMMLASRLGRDVHREVLMEALWPDAPPDAALHRLHVAASSLRRGLAIAGFSEVLHRHGEAYCLRLPGASLDLDDLEDTLRDAARRRAQRDDAGALGCWQHALDLYRGDLLAEAGPAEWVVGERERLRVAMATTASAAAEAALGLGRAEPALVAAQRAVALDPLLDTAWALLAEAQERHGDRLAAAATRHEHLLVMAALEES